MLQRRSAAISEDVGACSSRAGELWIVSLLSGLLRLYVVCVLSERRGSLHIHGVQLSEMLQPSIGSFKRSSH